MVRLLLPLLASLAVSARALYGGGDKVLEVTDGDYKAKLKGLTLLELYAPWCALAAALGRRSSAAMPSSGCLLGTRRAWRRAGSCRALHQWLAGCCRPAALRGGWD